MQTIRFECETITPMFMYGADGKTAELRPASIKGVMRFWWRAIHGNSNIKELKEAESLIFGSTKERSKVNIRVRKKEFKVKKFAEIKEKFDYLFFSIKMQNKEEPKEYFEKIKFEVILSSSDKKALTEASYSFILLSLFGGLGSRSRRGGGSFVINSISDENYSHFLLKDIKNLNNIYEKIREYFQNTYNISEVNNEYSTLSTLNFKLSSSKNSWNEALSDIETKYKKFRKENKLLNNASFGLPIIFEDTKNKIEVVTDPEFERRASPMTIKILKVQDTYYWLVLKLNGEFLPKGTKIKEKKDTSYKDIYQNIVDDFLKELRK